MEKLKSALEAFLNNEIKRKDLTEQLEQFLQQNPDSSSKLLSDLTNWHEEGKLSQDLYVALKFEIEQFNKINQANVTAIANSQTNQSINTNASIFQKNDNDEEVVPKQGLIIRDNYRLVERIGEGGMGVVWKAIDLVQEEGKSRNPYVAIKFLSKEFKQHPDALKALVREFARYKRLIHPNIVHAYELTHVDGTVFMVMEFLEGISLKTFIKANPDGVPLEQAELIIQNMGKALSYIHNDGIAHLDFKPDNIFYDPEKKIVKIIDFGIARLTKRSEQNKTTYDPGKLSAYTIPYATREMLYGLDPTPADDIYGLACVTYQLLSGKHPFNKKSAEEAEKEKLSPKPIDKFSNKQNKALLRALAFSRNQRTATVDQFLAELFPKKKKSSNLIVVGTVTALLLVAIFGIIFWLQYKPVSLTSPVSSSTNPVSSATNPVSPPEEVSPPSTDVINELNKQCKKHFDAKRFASAVDCYQQVLKLDSNNKDAKAGIKLIKEDEVTNLLQQCKIHLDAKRFTTGNQGNALDCYQQVLKIDRNNPDVKDGLKVMETFYRKKIETAYFNNQKDQAKKFFSRLEKVNLNSPALNYFGPLLYPNYIAKGFVDIKNGIGPGDDLEHGEKLFKQHCVICHGENGEGKGQAFFPRIQGQHYEYMLRQLKSMREREREGYPGMVQVIDNYTDRDIKAVADYTSRL